VLDKGSMTEKYALRQIARAKEDAIDPWLRKLNEQFAVISNWSGKCRVVEEQMDDVIGRDRLTKQTFDDFRNRWMHIKVIVGQNDKGMDVTQPLGQWWLSHNEPPAVRQDHFAPGREVPGAYNLWRGFACEARPGDCSLFLAHLKDNICKGIEEHYNYLIRWMARAVQKPDSPGYAAVVFRGGQGTGKSFVAKTFGGLFGRHFMQVTDPKHLVGSFNAHLARLRRALRRRGVLRGRQEARVGPEDADHGRDDYRRSQGRRRGGHRQLHPPDDGVERVVGGPGRHGRPPLLRPRGGRRCQGADPTSRSCSSRWRPAGGEALLHYLLTHGPEGLQRPLGPQDPALQQQKLFSMGTTEGWWYEKLRDGRIMPHHSDWNPDVTVYDLQEDYMSYCKQFNVARRGTAFALRQTLGTFCGDNFPEKYQGTTAIEATASDGTKKMFARPYWYRFPSLEVARAYWDAKFGGPYDWAKVETRETKETPSPF
jgi:hypothetical protein